MKNYAGNLSRRIIVLWRLNIHSLRESIGMLKHPVTKLILIFTLLALSGWSCQNPDKQTKPRVKVGVYYFDGWAGNNKYADNPDEPWAKNAPAHVTKRMVEDFPDREPVWGWRDDSLSIMEKQIDLAADNGIEFFAFCWYWRDTNGPINPEAIENLYLHTSLNLYMKAKNKDKIKFCLLVANHKGAEITGSDNWEKATEYWMKYFKDPQHFKVDDKPLVIIYHPTGIDNDALARMQEISKKQGLQGLSIAGCDNAPDQNFNYKTHYNLGAGKFAGSEEHDYSLLVEAHKKEWKGNETQPYIPEVTVGWDKRPWENKDGSGRQDWYFPRSPEKFKSFLTDAITWMDEHPTQTTRERVVLIYAWNELGEGGYLVPTKGDPEAGFLKVIKSVVTGK